MSLLKKKILPRIIYRFYGKIIEAENSMINVENTIRYSQKAQYRFNIPFGFAERMERGLETKSMNLKMVPIIIANIKGIKKSMKDLKKNPPHPSDTISDEILEDIKQYAKAIGIDGIGFTDLEPQYIFQEKAVLFKNAIVLMLEMDKEKMELSPHIKTGLMVMKTYNALGKKAIKLAQYIRNKGFASQAIHPLGGVVSTPPLGARAGLGWYGRNGLLISPEFGPRFRIAVVLTNINNLPFSKQNSHQWIEQYCDACGICVKKCPPQAIFTNRKYNDNGFITHIDRSKCFPYFANEYGCSICIKVCPFSRIGYQKILDRYKSK